VFGYEFERNQDSKVDAPLLTADILALHVGLVDEWIHGNEVRLLEKPLISLIDLLLHPGSKGHTNTGVDDVDDVL